jgi:hypothetical protein
MQGEVEGRNVAVKVIPHASLERSKAKQKVCIPLKITRIAEN